MTGENGVSISFSSGAARGFAYIGVIRALQEAQIKINHVLGSSIGAFACLMYVLEYTVPEMKSLAHSIDVADMIDVKLDQLALDDGYRLSRCIRAVLLEKGFSEQTTFLELYAKHPMKMTVLATDIMQGSCVHFDHEKTPDMPVALAVRASMSVPLLFAPVHHQDLMLVDGAVSCFLPEADWSFSVVSSAPEPLSIKPTNYQEYIARLLDLFFFQSFKVHHNTCVIPCDISESDKSTFIKTLMRRGYKEAKRFIQDRARSIHVPQTSLLTDPTSETCNDDHKKKTV